MSANVDPEASPAPKFTSAQVDRAWQSMLDTSLRDVEAKLDTLAGLRVGDAWNPERRAQVASNVEEIRDVLTDLGDLQASQDRFDAQGPLARHMTPRPELMTAEQVADSSGLDELAKLSPRQLVRMFAAGRPGRQWFPLLAAFCSMDSGDAHLALAMTSPVRRQQLIDSLQSVDLANAAFGRWIVDLAQRISELPTAAGRQALRAWVSLLTPVQPATVGTSGRDAQIPRTLALARLRGSVEPNGPNRTPHGATHPTGVAPLKACA